VRYCGRSYEACDGADALVLVTEWKEYRSPDFRRMKDLMRVPALFDGRNIWDGDFVRELGFDYLSIGRS
jgi:UDPglucose 6-dehydrogenase